jgi:hypothetical protein
MEALYLGDVSARNSPLGSLGVEDLGFQMSCIRFMQQLVLIRKPLVFSRGRKKRRPSRPRQTKFVICYSNAVPERT